MPYLLQNNQNRVENIKKKFENSYLSDRDYNKPIKNSNSFATPVKTNSAHVLRSGNVVESIVKHELSENKHSVKSDVNKPDGKALVRRSPAFRREKLNYGKNSTKVNNNHFHEQKKILTSNHCPDLIKLTNNTLFGNVLKEAAETSKHDSDIPSILNVSKQERDRSIRDNVNDQVSGKTPKKNELKLTDSIRLALKAPLPKGPPPKKPPRTFVHTMHTTYTVQDCCQPSKDDPALRLKLDKIEKVIKSLDSKRCGDTNWESSKVELAKTQDNAQSSSEVNNIYQAKTIDTFCLKNFNCISAEGYDKSVMYMKGPEKQSSFYIDCPKDGKDCNKTDNKDSYLGGKTISCDIKQKRFGKEPIYDLPYTKRTSFESFGKGGQSHNPPLQLHYMCTDVVNGSHQGPKTFSSVQAMTGDMQQDRVMNNVFHKPLTGRKEVIQEIEKDATKVNGFNPVLTRKYCSSVDANSDSDSAISDVEGSHFIKGRKPDDQKVASSNTTASRKTYVKRVSSILQNQSPYMKGLGNDSFNHLFESCILVGLTLGESKSIVPYIKSIFPPHIKPPPLIESLCFPDASTWTQSSSSLQQGEQYYSLVITNENGDRKFGYCRRVLPEGGSFCLPLVYCIISSHRANGFYYKVLQELESRHGSSELQSFMEQIYESHFPHPGQSLKPKMILEEVAKVSPVTPNEYAPSTIVRRPCDVRLEERDLSQLLQHLKVSVLLKVFGSLLLERKVLLLGHSLRNLSCCIEALQSLLIPFSWQHTLIPVLPNNLNEMCEAPTPFVIGLQKTTITPEFLSNLNLEEGIMVDLEESNVLKCCGDEASIIPQRLIKGLKTALNLALSATLDSDNDRNVLISEAFIRFFVEICGNYWQFMVKQPDGRKVFQKEEFVNSMPAVQSFLDWFVETAMFRTFIQDRLQNDIEDLFKRRALEHFDEGERGSALFQKNHKGMNKKVKTLGDRIKDLTLFTK